MARPIPVYLVSYDPEWPGFAALQIERLRVLEPLLVVVHHIGSTSVPGMAAKPVIDLMPLVADLDAFDSRQSEVEALGYAWHGEFGVEGRRFCTMDNDSGQRIVQLHCYQDDSPHAKRQLAFRDYLRAFPDVAAAYEAEKYRASALFPDNSVDYSREKGAFIRAAEAKALAWVVGEEGGD
jgi:GrpB-like predicted nucleotidyltransferase (UPF0157 family)